MPRRPVTIVAVVAVVALVAAAVIVWSHWWHGGNDRRDEPELQQAMSQALPDGRRFSWTDWAGVRQRLGANLSAESPVTGLRSMLAKGFTTDLTSTSALVDSAEVMQENYGFSPASLSWEPFSQSDTAAVLSMGLGPGADIDAIEQDLRTIGYLPPSTPDGMWTGNLDDIKRIGDVTPELTFLSIDRSAGVILGSDTDTGLSAGLEAYRAGESGGTVASDLGAVVGAVGSPTSAELYSGDQVCNALAMAQADPTDEAAGNDLIQRAGPVSPLTGFAMGSEPGGDIRVAMSFADDTQARTNATTRAKLASGPAPGQGGDFSDRFTLGTVEADGPVVTMQLKPVPGAYVLSDLDTGPLLFATC